MKRLLLAFSVVLIAGPVEATSTLYSNSTSVGIGTTSPASALQVYSGEAQIGSSGATCVSGIAGALRYASGSVYVCDSTNWDVIGGSSGGTLPALTSGEIWIGNGSNVATATAPSGDCTLSNTGALTCTKTNGTSFGTLATQFGVNLSTQATGTLQAAQFPALTGDVTTTAGSLATTVAAIQGTTVSGTTGTGNVVFSASPTVTGTLTGASSNWSGNVGIGTSSPTSPLTVDGKIESQSGGFKFPDGTTQTTAATSGSGGLVLLATVNASGASSVTFGSTYITSTYNKYVIEFDSLLAATSAENLELQVSSNNGSTWQTSGYSYSGYGYNQATGTIYSASTTGTYIDIADGETLTNTAHNVASGTIKFASPSGADKTMFDYKLSGYDNSNAIFAASGGGFYNTAGAMNAIKIFMHSGNLSGNFHLYGLSGT
jgi:hypothetical protein